MKKDLLLLFIIFLLFLSGTVGALNFNPGAYGSISDFLNSIYGPDPNAALTAFPILKIPMGGRSEGMAGAFSAVSDDISFIEYNPAGSSMLAKSELGFFHNNWIADSKLEGIAYNIRFGDLGLAAGFKWLYTPFTEYNMYAERVSNGYYSEGVATLNASYSFLSSFYFPGYSVGVNLKGAFRKMPDYADSYDQIIAGSGTSQSAIMLMGDVGFLVRFNFLKFFIAREKNASAALVVRNIGPPSKAEPLPTSINAAFSYRPIRPLLFDFDFSFPVNLKELSFSQKPHIAFGVSANVTKFLTMRTGVLLRPGSSRLTIGSAINLNKVAIDVNYTLDLLTQLQPLNRISLGIRFDLGDRGRSQNTGKAEELFLLGLEAYSRDNIADARLCWEEALRIDPKYDPARDSLIMLENREDLVQRIEELYRLEF